MLYAIAGLILGMTLLVFSAERFVTGASGVARAFHISPLIIGLTIVAFGTSAPEIFVAIIASLHGNPQIAVGNAIGSNITNSTMVIGATVLLRPIVCDRAIVKKEFPLLFAIMLAVGFMLWNHTLSRLDGLFLIVGFFVLIGWYIRSGLKQKDAIKAKLGTQHLPKSEPLKKSIIWLVIGLVLLLASSEITVKSAVFIAEALGISQMIIGLTVIAIGTSLPELAAAVAGALKGDHEISIGAVIGSNMFNLLAVLAMPALIAPTKLDPMAFYRDYFVMVGTALLLALMAWGARERGVIRRVDGAILLGVFVVYLGSLYLTYTGYFS